MRTCLRQRSPRLLVTAALVCTLGATLAAWGVATPAAALRARYAARLEPGLGGPGGSPTQQSFWLASATGGVWNFGTPPLGSPADGGPLAAPIVGITVTGSGHGYFEVASDGGIFAYGDAAFAGSMGGRHLNRPVVAMAPSTRAGGYWEVASDGGIFAFGDAKFHGSTGSLVLNRPVVAMAATPDGGGYWLVASDGGIFAFGDATFYGSTGSLHLAEPVVAMAATPDGAGYWLVASDGGIFAYGDAKFYGSTAGGSGDAAQKLVPTASGRGYWIVDQNGTAWPFGDAGPVAPPQGVLMAPSTPGDRAVFWAFTQLGKPYIWGGNGPAGYDCSGLALAAWENGAGIGFARVANDQYHTAGSPVPLGSLQAGDLVFWGSNHNDWTSVYHTAMYVGGGQIVESTGDHVQLNDLVQWGTDDVMPGGRRP